MAEFVMPSLGADMDAGTLVAWKKRVGEYVARGEILAEVETDKGVIAIEAFHPGVLERTLVDVGAKVPVGTPLAYLSDPSPPVEVATVDAPTAPEPTTESARIASPPPSAAPIARSPAGAQPALATISARALARENELEIERMEGSGAHGVVTREDVVGALRARPSRRITPYARLRARELGVVLAEVEPHVPGGIVVAQDVELAAQTRSSRAPLRDGGAASVEPEPLTPEQRMRRAIGAAMARSKREIPHYYVATTVDLEPVLERLAEHNARVSVADRVLPAVLLLRAAAFALARVPELNARCVGETAPPIAQVDLGVAIALRKGGLVAPPIFDATNVTLGGTMNALDDLVSRARAGRLTAREIGGGTITVTSLGDRGVESLYPIIYPPQVAIVGFGRIVERPWVVDGSVVARRVVTATLGADHRFSDGHRGGLYLAAIESLLASPDTLFADEAGGNR